MDVLYIIKEDHEKIRKLAIKIRETLTTLGNQKNIHIEPEEVFNEFARETKWHLHMEEMYLFPEITNVYPESEKHIKTCLTNHMHIKKNLKDLEDKILRGYKKAPSMSAVLIKTGAALEQDIGEHFKFEEEMLLPKIRLLIPTQEREDLGQVFHDVREELEMQGLVAVTADLVSGTQETKGSQASRKVSVR